MTVGRVSGVFCIGAVAEGEPVGGVLVSVLQPANSSKAAAKMQVIRKKCFMTAYIPLSEFIRFCRKV